MLYVGAAQVSPQTASAQSSSVVLSKVDRRRDWNVTSMDEVPASSWDALLGGAVTARGRVGSRPRVAGPCLVLGPRLEKVFLTKGPLGLRALSQRVSLQVGPEVLDCREKDVYEGGASEKLSPSLKAISKGSVASAASNS